MSGLCSVKRLRQPENHHEYHVCRHHSDRLYFCLYGAVSRRWVEILVKIAAVFNDVQKHGRVQICIVPVRFRAEKVYQPWYDK